MESAMSLSRKERLSKEPWELEATVQRTREKHCLDAPSLGLHEAGTQEEVTAGVQADSGLSLFNRWLFRDWRTQGHARDTE